MQKLRALHLYLGCIFAPMLIFFAVSGIWQTFYLNNGSHSKILALLSTLHTSHNLKSGGLTSPWMILFVVLMAVAFIITTILGVVMAVTQGRNRTVAWRCLAAGVIIPLLLVLVRLRS